MVVADRRMNHMIHIAAATQVRSTHQAPAARAYGVVKRDDALRLNPPSVWLNSRC
jgi:hypothetical protein